MSEGKKMNSMAQNEAISFGMFLSVLLVLIIRIPLTNMIGDIGNSYYSVTFELYEIFNLFFIVCMPFVISKMVEIRIRKNQFRNANRVFRAAFLFAITCGLISSLIVFSISKVWAGSIMLEPLGLLSVKIMAPSIFVMALTGVYRGYFQGLGAIKPTMFSRIIGGLFYGVLALVFTLVLVTYGRKVAALILNTNYGSAYGVTGIALAVTISGIISLVFMVFIYRLYKPRYEKQILRDRTTIHEPNGQIMNIFMSMIFPQFFLCLIFPLMKLLDQSIFNRIMIQKSLEDIRTLYYGTYYGKYDILISIPIAAITALALLILPKIREKAEENNLALLRDRVSIIIKYTWIFLIPFCAVFIVLNSTICDALYTSEIILAARFLRTGAVTVLLFGTAIVTCCILNSLKAIKFALINTYVALVIHIVALVIILKNTDSTIESILYANILFGIVLSLLNFLLIHKRLRYRQELVRSLLLPVLSGAVAGLLMLGINQLLLNISNVVISAIITPFIGLILYFVFIFALKVVSEKELRRLPGHTFYIKVSKKLHLLP